YAIAMLVFSALGLVVTYLIQRTQGSLPLNPQKLGNVPGALSFNTAASFTTNTNWQSYVPETTMSYFTQMAGLAWHNFTSAAVGIGCALVIARGLTRRPGPEGSKGVGNFYVDLIRAIVYVLLPACIVVALVLVSQGVIQNLAGYHAITTLEGGKQLIAMGPVASQEAIKELGTNGGGFFNANSAHPFENPSVVTNFIEMVLIFVIPAGMTYTYGRMAKDQRQGWVLFAAMSVLFLAGVTTAYWAESHPNPVMHNLAVATAPGNMEGKELRFGVTNSALFATVTTDASCGAINSWHDSFTPLGGLVPMVNIELGEVVMGGVGAGLYGMLIFVVLTVFIAGLMVGRTPEYLGKKIEGREMKLAMLYVLVFPLIILGFTGWAAVASYGNSSVGNAGSHGLSEMLYAFTSAAGNNGSAFGGLNANTDWWNICLGFAMLAGRFFMILPALALAGVMLNKKTVAPGLGTFPTNGWLFTALLVAVILVVGALTFFPALSLGPVVEHFQALRGEVL
ncbi:MAG TPA: potassium-transporting ATPase subunit KdpA, partial [Kofleriaceae bacterium]